MNFKEKFPGPTTTMSSDRAAVIALFLFCMAGMSSTQTDTERCSDMLTKVNELKTAIEGACSTTTTAPPYSPYKWTSVTKTQFGSANLQHASTLSFTIPSIIPSTAREVLVYVTVRDGSHTRGPENDLKVFTQIDTTRYEKYIHLHPWPTGGPHHDTNSDNLWFPMPPNRRVYLTVPAAHGLWVEARLLAIGYR